MRTEVARLFVATVPEEFCRGTIECLTKACSKSFEDTRFLPYEEAKGVRPILLRGYVEASWRALAARFPELTAKAVINKAKNHFHTEVRSQHFLITESKVSERGVLARPSLFRRKHAASGNLAFSFYDKDTVVIDGIQPALLQYRPAKRQPWELEFAEIVFLNEGYTGVLDRIDLLAQYGQPAESAPVETVSAAPVTLRAGRRTEGGTE